MLRHILCRVCLSFFSKYLVVLKIMAKFASHYE